MGTRKLYYEDCHMASFSASVTACRETEQGYEVELDATAFYPEGGGQTWDTGTLGATRVLAVTEEGGAVIHLCDRPLQPGQQVEGVIDYDRRFDLMQQHTGEHILSGLIHNRFGFHNMGFHVGAQCMEVDFDGVIPQEALPELELAANRAVWANLPVVCRIPSREELPGEVYRAKRLLEWPVRLVQIPGVDSCACCGVHTAFTGEVGLIKILSCVKFRQGVRLEVACGGRALSYVNLVWEQNRKVSQLLSAKLPETASAVERLQTQLGEEKLRTAQLQKQLLQSVAQGFAGKGDVVHVQPGLTGGELRALAEQIGRRCGGIAAVICPEAEGCGICLACPGGDVSELGKALLARLGGRGGGKGEFFQGRVGCGEAELQSFLLERFS